ncbi:MAG TPA: hypothetical protein VFV50_00425 [Bdellovibrionales bacterium]|nr:hypothetical protein [Bdellovibrionales bacterium]
MKKAWGAIALLAIAVLGWLALRAYQDRSPAPMASPDPFSSADLTVTPTAAPDGDELPQDDGEDDLPDPALVAEVEKLEFELMELMKQRPDKDEDFVSLLRKIIGLIDQLLLRHPPTSIRYAELIESRHMMVMTLINAENPPADKREALERENIGLARDFVRLQPKSALAHEVLGKILSVSDSAESKKAFQECLLLEPSNQACKSALAAFELPKGTPVCESIKSDIGYYLGSEKPAPEFPIKVKHAGQTIYLARAPSLDSRHISKAWIAKDTTGTEELRLTFTREGSELFAELTSNNIGKVLAFGDRQFLFSAPVIREPVKTGGAIITLGAQGRPKPATVLTKMCLRVQTAQ